MKINLIQLELLIKNLLNIYKTVFKIREHQNLNYYQLIILKKMFNLINYSIN